MPRVDGASFTSAAEVDQKAAARPKNDGSGTFDLAVPATCARSAPTVRVDVSDWRLERTSFVQATGLKISCSDQDHGRDRPDLEHIGAAHGQQVRQNSNFKSNGQVRR